MRQRRKIIQNISRTLPSCHSSIFSFQHQHNYAMVANFGSEGGEFVLWGQPGGIVCGER
jgi:hypothetical protein